MPGILKMDYNASNGSVGPKDGENRKRDHEGKLINGERNDAYGGGAVNGAPSKAYGSSTSAEAPGTALSGLTADQLAELPPEIVKITEEHYFSLSTLLLRISQESYNDLNEVLQKMSDIPIQQQTNGVLPNGAGQHAGQANADANKQKKLLLMKFAQDNRAKFIKLLVLTEWGKRAAKDVSKLIDILGWASEQLHCMDHVDVQLERIKIFSNSAAEKNPDILTALEILSTGKAPWMPTLGYIPPDPISSEKALKLLRSLNTSLSIRLNVHEDLPRRLRNWRVDSGRATFVIENELEFDLVSFVEDASEQWFFVDLRMLFSPAPSVAVGSQFFMRLKEQADFVLKGKGLAGLYDFLQNFALTHKISVLRSQAVELARSGWSGSLKVEPVHRELVVQYWTARPGKKNWVEIGISINKPKNGKQSWRGPPIPSLTARWFRQGKLVEDADLKIDWHELSFEKVMKRVIALHTCEILRATQRNLDSKIAHNSTLSDVEPVDCKLQVTLGPNTNAATLSLEPVTGTHILRPATTISARAENAFNQGREPPQMAFILAQALAQNLRDLVQRFASQLGWNTVSRQALQLETLKSTVNSDVIQYTLYSPRGWTSQWCLAVVIDSSGVSWWIFEMGGNGSSIEYAEQIKLDRTDGTTLAIDRMTLASLERVALQLLSIRATTRRLEKEKKAFSLRYEFGQTRKAVSSRAIAQGWVLHLQTIDLLAAAPGEKPWLETSVGVVCQGMRPDGRNVWHIATGKMMKEVAADLQKLMAASPQSGFKLSKDGHFRILLSAPFGQDITGDLRGKLRDVNRLRSFATTLHKRSMLLGPSSLQRVHFQYGPSPHVAAVAFGSGKEVTIELSHNNPHFRVRKLLTEIANERIPSFPLSYQGESNGLDRFCTAIVITRSVLTALKNIESQVANTVRRNPAIHVHSIFKYRITYENPVCTFDVRAQAKDDKVHWFIEDNFKQHSLDLRPSPERSQGHRRLENLQAKLKELFASKAERWFGTRNGLIANIDGVSDALNKLNEIVLSCTMEGGYKPPPPLEPTAPQTQNQNQNQASSQPQQNGVQQSAQQARMQQARQQQQQQQQAQNQARKQQPQQGQRGQMPNGRPQQYPQLPQQGKMGGRPGMGQQQQQGIKQDIIEID